MLGEVTFIVLVNFPLDLYKSNNVTIQQYQITPQRDQSVYIPYVINKGIIDVFFIFHISGI